MSIYGYVRVSTKEQNVNRQLDNMFDFNIEKGNIFIDKSSGKSFNRPNYIKLMKKLHAGDTLVIQSIDRLGRNYDEIIEQWKILTKKKNINIVVIDMPLLNTKITKNKDITFTFLSDIILQLLSYVAEIERKKIKERQKEGIASAKKRGVVFGRPALKVPNNFYDIYKQVENGKILKKEAVEKLNISYPTFLKWTQAYKRE